MLIRLISEQALYVQRSAEFSILLDRLQDMFISLVPSFLKVTLSLEVVFSSLLYAEIER